jgi:hypothetical protein
VGERVRVRGRPSASRTRFLINSQNQRNSPASRLP